MVSGCPWIQLGLLEIARLIKFSFVSQGYWLVAYAVTLECLVFALPLQIPFHFDRLRRALALRRITLAFREAIG